MLHLALPCTTRSRISALHRLLTRMRWLQACVETAAGGVPSMHGEYQAGDTTLPAAHRVTLPLPREIRRIDVTVVEAKSLAKQGDYFAYVHLGTQPMARTHILRGATTPYWGKRFTFDKIPRSFRVSFS